MNIRIILRASLEQSRETSRETTVVLDEVYPELVEGLEQ